jgi:hypothetical protein
MSIPVSNAVILLKNILDILSPVWYFSLARRDQRGHYCLAFGKMEEK